MKTLMASILILSMSNVMALAVGETTGTVVAPPMGISGTTTGGISGGGLDSPLSGSSGTTTGGTSVGGSAGGFGGGGGGSDLSFKQSTVTPAPVAPVGVIKTETAIRPSIPVTISSGSSPTKTIGGITVPATITRNPLPTIVNRDVMYLSPTIKVPVIATPASPDVPAPKLAVVPVMETISPVAKPEVSAPSPIADAKVAVPQVMPVKDPVAPAPISPSTNPLSPLDQLLSRQQTLSAALAVQDSNIGRTKRELVTWRERAAAKQKSITSAEIRIAADVASLAKLDPNSEEYGLLKAKIASAEASLASARKSLLHYQAQQARFAKALEANLLKKSLLAAQLAEVSRKIAELGTASNVVPAPAPVVDKEIIIQPTNSDPATAAPGSAPAEAPAQTRSI